MLQDKLKRILDSIDSVIEKSVQDATQTILRDSSVRIFNKGKDKENQQIGTYSESYKKIKEKKGRQTSFVDLTFTSALSKSIAANENQVYFSNDYGVKVAGYNETRFKKRIFAPSDEERKLVIEFINEDLAKLWKL